MIDFKEHKLDALLVSALPNVRYLTGFTGSNGLALLTPESITLITDPRYDIQSRSETRQAKLPTKVVIARKHLWEAAAAAIQRLKIKRTGFESARVTYDFFKALDKALPPGYSLKPTGPLIETLRMVKTEEEIAHIRRAVQTNSEAFAQTAPEIRLGITEAEIAANLDHRMRQLGAQAAAFETIVASGSRTALPHARPSNRPVQANELILIDMGAAQDGYMSDMTRMLSIGKPDRKARAMFDSVLEAQLAAVGAVRPGVTTQHVDRQARKVLAAAGLDKAFVHSTGHGLGLEIHEAPRVGKKDATRLLAGMVITIEPGAYVEGTGGVRIEDTVLVTANGCEVLTPTAKELMVL